MAKHSKWSKVKNYKGTADSRRAHVFTKLGRLISVTAKRGGADPAMNFQLRMAIEKAREANMPKDTIDRAVLRGAGGDGSAVIEEVLYEAIGPGGVALLIHVFTDSKNRTLNTVRLLLSKGGGTFAGQNAVAWQFTHRGVLRVVSQDDVDAQTLALIDLGVDDVVAEDEGMTVLVSPEKLEVTKHALEKAGMTVEFAEAMYVPKEKMAIEDPVTREKVAALIEALEADEDIDDVTSNADVS